jgi:hypothetical protein
MSCGVADPSVRLVDMVSNSTDHLKRLVRIVFLWEHGDVLAAGGYCNHSDNIGKQITLSREKLMGVILLEKTVAKIQAMKFSG